MKTRTIFESTCKTFRIIEVNDSSWNLDDLKGDVFNPIHNPSVDPKELKRLEKQFESQIDDLGVFGYVLERWDQRPGQGYIEVDSCYGFVGMYLPEIEFQDHYIIDEMKQTIERRLNGTD